MKEIILIISVIYAITLILFGFLIKYYRNEIQRLFNDRSIVISKWEKALKDWDKTIEELVLRGNKILELVNSINILKNQTIRYSKICRKLYNDNQFLKLEIDKLNLVLTLQNEKIAELEKGKLKEKREKK